MLNELISILLFPISFLAEERPIDHPSTKNLIYSLRSIVDYDSVKIVRNPEPRLKRMGEVDSVVSIDVVREEHTQAGIKNISDAILKALIFPPDDVLLCTDVIGYLVFYKEQTSDTISIDDGGKILRHKVNGTLKFSYYEGDLWRELVPNSQVTTCCNQIEDR